mmetsp:Transcript_5031/g.8772  ORF Transcript_5031/g.8772 Transcript_5031/m.8772 type:complete len:84 (-) Transcript_5031:587-838(-)
MGYSLRTTSATHPIQSSRISKQTTDQSKQIQKDNAKKNLKKLPPNQNKAISNSSNSQTKLSTELCDHARAAPPLFSRVKEAIE